MRLWLRCLIVDLGGSFAEWCPIRGALKAAYPGHPYLEQADAYHPWFLDAAGGGVPDEFVELELEASIGDVVLDEPLCE